MSGQWEVVKGKNERRSKVPIPKVPNKQPDGRGKKTNIFNGIQLEDVLPKSQVQNLYSGKASTNKDSKPPLKAKQNDQQKKAEKKPNKSTAEPPKPKPPKSIEAALLAISSEEFSAVFDHSKRAFPDTPIIWLKELTQFLNQKIPIELQDPVFSNKPAGYPLNVMPSSLTTTIEKAIREAGKSNAQLYFNIALTSMVTDLSKGLPAVGYRFFLQYIALNEPKLVTENLAKHIALRNSYQNRANVALPILWAVGYVGLNDFQSGFKVFEELQLPLIDLKNYTRYVLNYLVQITSQDQQQAHLTKEQYLLIVDTVYSKSKNFPADLHKKLEQNLPKVKKMLFGNKKENLTGWVEPILKKTASTTNQAYQNSLCDIVVDIFTRDQSTLATWNKLYTKNLMASAALLRYISNNYDSINPSLKQSLKPLLLSFSTLNEDMSLKKRKDDGLKEAIYAVKKVAEQKQTPQRSSGLFRKLLTSLLIVAWIAVLAEPLYRPNKPRDELYLFRFGSKLGDGALWIDSKLEQIIPKVYYGKAKEVARPYGALAGDLLKVTINVHDNIRSAFVDFINQKYPLLVASIDAYAPGLIDNTQLIFRDAFAKTINYYHISVNYLQREVFVGQLSPENIQRVVVGAYNTTSEKAIEYYHWVYQKVQTTIK